jgi:hypothetical protein
VVDSALGGLAPEVEAFSPTGGLPSAIQGLDPENVGSPEVDFLAVVPAVAAMLAWIGVLFAAGGALLIRRDVE